MNTACRLVLGVAACLTFLPGVVDAQCVTFDDPEELFARADVVFVGTVMASQPAGTNGAHAIVEIATFRVEQSWKGKLEPSVRVGADRAFEGGTRYLVFAAGSPLSTTTLCRWTEPVEKAGTRLGWLAQRHPEQALADARQRWASHRIRAYEFTFQARCFCDPEFTQPVTFRVSQAGNTLLPPGDERVGESLARYNTIQKLFDLVQAAIDKRAFRLTVTYDEELGYPRSARVDYEKMAEDEEMAFTVTNFRVLEKAR